jgi:hypothetical protein
LTANRSTFAMYRKGGQQQKTSWGMRVWTATSQFDSIE